LRSIEANSGLFSVQELYLQDNYLTKLEQNTFDPLTNLIILSLENNLIISINRSIFSNLVNLEHVYLTKNPLTIIQSDVVQQLCGTSPKCKVHI
jgi:hypothetical protein